MQRSEITPVAREDNIIIIISTDRLEHVPRALAMESIRLRPSIKFTTIGAFLRRHGFDRGPVGHSVGRRVSC